MHLLFVVRLAVLSRLGLAETNRMSNGKFDIAAVAQPVERVLGKDEVMGSTPISSSSRF